MEIKGYLIHNLVHKEVPFFATQIKAFQEAFKKEDVELKTVDNLHALEVIKKDKPSFVLFWDKDISLVYELMNLHIKVFNNVEALRLCDDKAFTYSMLAKNKVRTPKTLVMPLTFYRSGIDYFDEIKKMIKIEGFVYPFIVKIRCSSLGLGVFLVHNDEELKNIIKEHWYRHLLIQEFIDYEIGTDYRVFLINHRPQVAVSRSNKNDFRSNVYQGGEMKVLVNPNPALLKIAIRASLALKLDFGAIDIVKDKNGKYYVLEVNSNARTATIDKVANISLTQNVVKYILRNI